MKYSIERVKLGDEEILAFIQTESWKNAFKNILPAETMQKFTQIEKITAMLWVFKDNERARRFYEAHEFVPNGKEQLNFGKTEICYERNLLDMYS